MRFLPRLVLSAAAAGSAAAAAAPPSWWAPEVAWVLDEPGVGREVESEDCTVVVGRGPRQLDLR